MPVIAITDPHDARIAQYRNVPDPVLLREAGLFVAEGRLVVRQMLSGSRVEMQSLLVTEAARQSLDDLISDTIDIAVYLVPQPLMNGIVGFNIHRGCLALGFRPAPSSVRDLLCPAAANDDRARAEASISRIVVLEAVSNVDNVGGIFRSVAALGGHAVVVGPGCGDPLYRKAIRTSMGATLRVPFATADPWPEALHDLGAAGFTRVALTPDPSAARLEDVAADLRARARVALVAGAEGEGLTAAALACADLRVCIPMAPGVDSINVATATAIALYRIARTALQPLPGLGRCWPG